MQTSHTSHTDTHPHSNRFPWETLCATSLKEILGAEKARSDVESDLSHHMLQYVEFDNLINPPISADTSVIPQNVQGPITLQTRIKELLHEYEDISRRTVQKELAKLDPFCDSTDSGRNMNDVHKK